MVKGGTEKIILLPVVLFVVISFYTKTNAQVQVLNTEILPHPRILFTLEEELATKAQFGSVPLLDSLYAKLLERAGLLLGAPVQEYSLDSGQDILDISREQIYRMVTLAMAYRFSGDKRFADKGIEELVNVCNYSTWNPRHFLDVAEMATAVGIGYDWLYNVIPPETKKLVVQAIKEKALDAALNGLGNSRNMRSVGNWNIVCNAGIVVGALAIAEEFPDVAGIVIENAVKYAPNCLQYFAPDGVFFEGPAYWGYTNAFLAVLSKTLDDNFKHDFGLSGMEGISKSATYFMRTLSPSGRPFNFADSSPDPVSVWNRGDTGGHSQSNPYPDGFGGYDSGIAMEYSENPFFFFLSRRFNQPEVAAFYRRILSVALVRPFTSDRFFFLSIPWFDNSVYSGPAMRSELEVFKGKNIDIILLNGKKKHPVSKNNSIYLIAKSGSPHLSHQQMDIGTFVLETNGVRWCDDLGTDDYLPGYFDSKKRWTFYRNTNYCHNTLTIDNKLQHPKGVAKLIGSNANIDKPFATVDMTDVYKEQASAVFRTFRLMDDRTVAITDNVELLSPEQTVQWTVITQARVECSGKRATFSRDGKKFYLKIVSPADAEFSISPAKKFMDVEKPVDGFSIVRIVVTNRQAHKIQVLMSSKKI